MSRSGVFEHAAGARAMEPEPPLNARTRTRSEVKWLANELAAVKGELERIDEELARLQARKGRLLAVQRALSDVAGALTVPELPVVVPAVRANERFGARGSLRNLMREVLRQAYPQGVSTSSLADTVIEAFGLQVTGPKERKRLVDNTIRSTLTKLYLRGEVEPVHSRPETGGPVGLVAQSGVWRLKVKELRLVELRRGVGVKDGGEGGGEVAGLAGAAAAGEAEGAETQECELWR